MYRVPVFAKKTFIVLVGAPWPLATPCPEFQCCQTLGQRHPTKMNVFFATGSTRGEGVANIDIWGAGGVRLCGRLADERFFRKHRNRCLWF